MLVETLAFKEIAMTACGRAHSLFLTKEGRLYACGFNEFGELGIDMGETA